MIDVIEAVHMTNVLKIFSLALLAIGTPAFGQTQAQQDRLDRVAQFVVTAPMCERLGMKLEVDLPTKVESALKTETASWQVAPTIVEKLMGEALSRQGAMLKTDLEASVAAAKTDAQLRNIRTILMRYGRTCMAATFDPIFAKLILLPPGYDLDKAATDASDSLLVDGGLAGWQTPRIQARGDLMAVPGKCRAKIGPARPDALLNEFGRSDDPRVRAYYRKSFDDGLADPTAIKTLAGCNRAIQNLRLTAQNAAGR